MTRLSIRAGLTLAYLAVLAVATVTLAGGAWWLFYTSMTLAADASLAERVDGTRRFIDATEHELPPEELSDEFGEFASLTRGETVLEVSDENGRVLCRPALAGWSADRIAAAPAAGVVAASIGGDPYRALSTSLAVGAHRYRVTTAIPMRTEYAALRRFGWLLTALVAAVMPIAAAAGFWLSGRALAPVDRMTRDVQRISVSDPSRRLEVPAAGDELSRLAGTFNDMLVRWQSAFADMVRFTADASHELRTPISLTRTTAELALARPRTEDEYRTALSRIHAHTERMSALVEDLLTLARADAGVELPELAPVDLRDVASDVLGEGRSLAERRALGFDTSIHCGPILVSGGRESLRRLLWILLDNACRYTAAGGSVRLDVSIGRVRDEPKARIAIVDSGLGISPEDRPRVFDRFYRGSQAREAAPDGSGLGLSIARMIVERHGGQIVVSQPASGVGCVVEVALPLLEQGAGADTKSPGSDALAVQETFSKSEAPA
jgi:two-component system, OmpR family, heavy metal sensor histidine kinase CusS